mmetsp:Transcript_20294/g.22465  ORF Transcript_20294/g.22465 Transcript_20294/m.22465 type:complete len:86 (-) Transcript_20294:146-403(-)
MFCLVYCTCTIIHGNDDDPEYEMKMDGFICQYICWISTQSNRFLLLVNRGPTPTQKNAAGDDHHMMLWWTKSVVMVVVTDTRTHS